MGTFNINASQKFKVWRDAIARFRTTVEVAGLQEVNSDRKRHFLDNGHWGAFWPEKLGQNPVIWDQRIFERVSARGVKIATARRVGHEKPGSGAHRKAAYATVVRLRHLVSGQTISVVDVRLSAGAVNNGRPIDGNPRLYRRYVDEVAGLVRVVAAERRWTPRRVYVVGDFNNNYPADKRHHRRQLAYSRLTRAGLTSAWESRKQINPRHGSGTRAGSYLDNIWSVSTARRVDVDRRINVSDHYPVTARIRAAG